MFLSSHRSDAEDSPASVYETDEEESDNVSTFVVVDVVLPTFCNIYLSYSSFVPLEIFQGQPTRIFKQNT